MCDINKIFFEIICVAIGTQDTLSRQPSPKEWAFLYDMAKKQSLVGVCFAALQRLGADPSTNLFPVEKFARIGINKMQYLTWMGLAAKIQQRNQVVDEQTAQFYKMVSDRGYKACVLKGQAVNSLYGNLRSLRQSGDIDMWMVAEPMRVIEWARATGSMYYYDYHHADLNIFPDTEIELHYRPSLSRNLFRNIKLQNWFKEEGGKHIIYRENLGFAVPDYTFNVVLTLNHNFWHLLYEGVGMRQIMDLYFVLKSCPIQEQKEEAHKLLKYLKLERFTSACMWILKEIFRLEDEYLLCEPDESAGRFLLDEIMQAGNFGKHDERLKDGRYKTSRVNLMWSWMRHTFRLFKYYPADVLWTPIGILRISFWRRCHYRKENELKKI